MLENKGNVLCRVSCFWCMRPPKHWQILAKRPGLATVAPPIIYWIVAPLVWWCSGTRRSNNCVYLRCLNCCCCHDFIRVCSTLPRWSQVPPLMAGLGFLVLIYSLCLIHIGGHSQLSATVHQSTSVTKYIHGSELGLKTYLSDLHYCPPGCTLSLHVRNLSKQKYLVKILAAHFPAHRKYD